MSFADTYLDETARILERLDRAALERMAERLAADARLWRASLRARRRRLGGARVPRRQRLPQALRVRGLHAHGQRV